MSLFGKLPAAAALLLLGPVAAGAQAPSTFAPLLAWQAAVMAGDEPALSRLYSLHPAANVQVGASKISNIQEWRYWMALKSAGLTGLNPKVLQIAEGAGQARLLLRVEAETPSGPRVASMLQIWAQQPDGWYIVASRRTTFSSNPARRLPQPATPDTALYPDPKEAPAQLKAASELALKEHKRVLLVFGANWCYDCHVLDTTFHSKDFARLVDANYVVVHISIGDEGKENRDLAARFGVALDHGVPSLAVLDPDGKVLVAQKSGEFESTIKIGPDEVRAFLETWKPSPK
jgi:hypothetical protein